MGDYEPVKGYPPQSHAHLPREILSKHAELEIRNDLIDCGIDICSVEVRPYLTLSDLEVNLTHQVRSHRYSKIILTTRIFEVILFRVS